MGAACLSQDVKDEEKKNRDIGNCLRNDRQRRQRGLATKKVLLLGAEGVGKKTIMKQWQMIFGRGYDEQMRMKLRASIRRHLLQLLLALSDNNNNVSSSRILINDDDETIIAYEINRIWTQNNICNEKQNYWFENVSRIIDRDYIPNDKDIVMLPTDNNQRMKTQEIEFQIRRTEYQMINPQSKGKLRKFIHSFEMVDAVIFVADLSSFDSRMIDKHVDSLVTGFVAQITHLNMPPELILLIARFCDRSNENSLKQQMQLFTDICDSEWFRDSTLILFLNKIDLFRDKLMQKPLSECEMWSDFPLWSDDEAEYFRDKFESCATDQVFSHLTCATDRANMQKSCLDMKCCVDNMKLHTGTLLSIIVDF